MRKRTLAVAAWGLTACLGLTAEARAQAGGDVAVAWTGGPGAPGHLPVALAVLPHDGRAAFRGEHFTVRARNHADRVVVSCGVLVLRRDDRARLHAQARYVLRPRFGLLPGRDTTVSLPVGGTAPEVELRPTFALFADGSWAGDAAQARLEIAARREEYAAARFIAEAVAALPVPPTRAALVRLAGRFSERLARAATTDGRAQYEAALRTLATTLDERTGGRRSYADGMAVVRRRVERVLSDGARLTFLGHGTIKE